MSGQQGDLSPKQEAAVKQIKDAVKDVKRDDWDDRVMMKFLRARDFDLKKTEKMLRDNVVWRKQFGADEIAEWDPPEVIKKYYPGGFFGTDKDGYPIYYDLLGLIDLKGIFFSATKKDMLRYRIHSIEYLRKYDIPKLSKKAGKDIDLSCIIFDMEGLGLKHLWKPAIDLFNVALSVMEANYPEGLKTAFIINAPKLFPVMWKLAKPFLHEETRKKIRVLGKNWKKHLLEHIDADQLPVHWGGTATDPDGDECCRSKICMGGKIPEKYRLKNVLENFDMSVFDHCTVQRGSSVQLDYDVPEAGSSIRWQFLTEGNDIGFGIFLRTADERQKKADMEAVVKSERVNSHMYPEEGSVVLEKAGTYVVRFDNTYSYVNAKKVSFLIDVCAPDKDTGLEVTAM